MNDMRRFVRGVASVLLSAMLLSGCSKPDELIVSAAASLTNAFTELGQAYERDNPGKRVMMNFAGSGSLLRQIEQGAPVDVFASADQETMDRAQRQGLIENSSRTDFAGNVLVLIAPNTSDLQLNTLEDLRSKRISRIAISDPETVPVGRYAKRVLRDVGMWDVLQSRFVNTQHVRQSLDYVARGEVDVGFVYATDAAAMPDKVRTLLPVQSAIGIAYPIAVVADSRQQAQAKRFIDFVRSPKGQSILQQFGFRPPG